MPLISTLGAMSSRGFGEFNQQAQGKYIEDYFSTWLYTGNGSSQTINNGIPLITTAEWSTTNLGSGSGATACAVDSAGNIYVGGSSDFRKINSSGVTQWTRTLAISPYFAVFNSVTISSSDEIYVCGNIFDSTSQCFFVAKYDTSGTLLWNRTLQSGAIAASYGNAVTTDSSGNVYAGGQYTDTGSSIYGYFIKLNSSGTVQFQRTYRETSTNTVYAIYVDSSNNIYLTGNVAADTLYVAKWDSSGSPTWQRKVTDTTANGSRGQAITVDSSGNVYVTGVTSRSAEAQIITIKYDSSGTLQWQRKHFDASTSTLAYSAGNGITIDSAGTIHVAATGYASTGYLYTLWIRYNSSGTALTRIKFYQTTADVRPYGIVLNGPAGIVIPADTTVGNYIKLPISGIVAGQATFLTQSNPGTEAAGTATDAASTANTSSASFSLSSPLSGASLTKSSSVTTQAATDGAGLVWIKGRSGATDHALYDTARGATRDLVSNSTAAQTTQSTGLTTFTSSGFSIGTLAKLNTNAATYASWTWRETPKFFDVVTWTGNDVDRSISHNLGSAPGMVIVKNITSSASWVVWHRSITQSNSTALLLDLTNATTDLGVSLWGALGGTPNMTATTISIGTNSRVNVSGNTYVAYIFAHNAGGFGLDGSQNVISCGSFTTDASGNATVNLGYEPQWVLAKRTDAAQNWFLVDNMRGLPVDSTGVAQLNPNTPSAESLGLGITPTSTGLNIGISASATYIYMAIRRGPMKVPTSGTSVFSPNTRIGTGSAVTYSAPNFAPDTLFSRARTSGQSWASFDRLRGGYPLIIPANSAEDTTVTNAVTAYTNTGFQFGIDNSGSISGYVNGNSFSYIYDTFARAPGFMDVVCYSGTGTTTQNVTHNLGVQPELIIYKTRSNTADWIVHTPSLISQGKFLFLNRSDAAADNSTQGYTNSGTPTSTLIRPGMTQLNMSGWTYVAYLFATCAGVSKVGTYTGNNATQTINCGFTGGARYVMIKRTDSTGIWWVWDTARGMAAGTDPRLPYNSTAGETNANWVYTTTGGFEIVTADASINAGSSTYIYLAIA